MAYKALFFVSRLLKHLQLNFAQHRRPFHFHIDQEILIARINSILNPINLKRSALIAQSLINLLNICQTTHTFAPEQVRNSKSHELRDFRTELCLYAFEKVDEFSQVVDGDIRSSFCENIRK